MSSDHSRPFFFLSLKPPIFLVGGNVQVFISAFIAVPLSTKEPSKFEFSTGASMKYEQVQIES